MENLPYYLALLLFSLVIFKHFFHRNSKLPPSPFALPIIGHLHLIKNSPQEALNHLSSKHGPILFLRFGSRPTLVVSSPSAVEECFTKNDVVFANRPRSIAGDYLTYNYTAVVWAPYGDLWRSLRRLAVVELFSSKSLQKSSIVREQEIRNILSHLMKIGNREVDLEYWFTLLTFNMTTRLVAGDRCVRDEDAGTELGKRFVEGLKEKFLRSSPSNLCDYVPILRWIDYGGVKKSMVILQKKRDEFLQGLIDQVRRKRADEGGDKKTLIGTLLCLQESEPDFYTDDLIKSLIVVMFLGGTGTSIVTMERAVSFLLNHPLTFQKARAEIDNQVGHRRLLDDSDLSKLPFLQCVINETLRLYPPAPLLLPHYSSEDCTVGGFEVPRGTTLLVNASGLHRDPKVWEEPDKFKPERFEGEREGFKFVPFGIGRRACPGANMGVRAISLALGSLIQCFELEEVREKKSLIIDSKPPLKAEALKVVCIPRKNALELLSQFQN
ncbi:unnamed protein product [Camellia sinensis]